MGKASPYTQHVRSIRQESSYVAKPPALRDSARFIMSVMHGTEGPVFVSWSLRSGTSTALE
jgi:hypothetical protein